MSQSSETSVSTSPGQHLREARKAKQWSIEDVARKINLSTYLVQAIEDDDYTKMEGAVFAKGYLRLYANVIGANQHQVLDYFDKVVTLPVQETITIDIDRTHNHQRALAMNKRFMKWGIIVILLGLVTFAAAEYRNYGDRLSLPNIKMAFLPTQSNGQHATDMDDIVVIDTDDIEPVT